jgi:hypothetical protein
MQRTAEETEQHYLKLMGAALGAIYHGLWKECVSLHIKWKEHVLLFGDAGRVELLNKVAPGFFGGFQDLSFEDVLLHISRMTDDRRVGGGGGKETLTLKQLPELVALEIRGAVKSKLDLLVAEADFARQWRHRLLAHRELALALGTTAIPLPPASRSRVGEMLQAIADLLNAVETHYCDGPVGYDYASRPGDADSLVFFLKKGLDAQSAEWGVA